MALKDDKQSSSRVNSVVKPAANRRVSQQDDHLSSFSMIGIRARLLHSNFMKVVLGLLIVIFAVGFGISSLNTGSLPHGNNGGPQQTPDTVAHIGSEDISGEKFSRAFQRHVDMMEQFGQKTDVMGYMNAEQTVLQQLADESLQYQKAQQEGFSASNDDIDKDIVKRIDDEIKGQSSGDREAGFRRQIEAQYGSVDAYKEKMREGYDRDAIARQLVVDKLEKSVKDKIKVNEDDFKRSVTKLKLRQIVIRPKVATPAKDAKDTKTEEEKNQQEAKTRAERLAAQLRTAATPQTFGQVAMKESDDFMTKKKGGQLDEMLPSALPVSQNVKDALMNTDPKLTIIGPLQDENSKDYYVFYVEGRKLDLPKDYAKKKDEQIKQYQEQKANEAWTKYKEDLSKQTKPEIHYPALAAYKMQMEDVYKAPPADQDNLRRQIVQQYQDGLRYAGGREAAAIYFQLSQLYQQLKQPEKALEALQEAAKKDERDVNLQIRLAGALTTAKKNDDALKALDTAKKRLEEDPPRPSMFGGNPADDMHRQIAMEYDRLGKKDLAAAERAQIKPPTQPGMGGGFGGMGGGGPITINPGGGR